MDNASFKKIHVSAVDDFNLALATCRLEPVYGLFDTSGTKKATKVNIGS